MKIIGHRGAGVYEPENTLRSIDRAIDLGAEMLEFDVTALRTGEVILMHDDHVDRTTNASGRVQDMSFEQIRALNAGCGEQVPTLQEVIERVDRRARLNVEIKGSGSATAVAGVLGEYMLKGWGPDDFVVASFNHHELYRTKQLLPEVAAAGLIYSAPLDHAAFCERLGASIVAPSTDLVTPEFVADAHDRGLPVYAWIGQPIFDEADVRRLYGMGVDGIYSDRIDRDRAIVAALQRESMPFPGLAA